MSGHRIVYINTGPLVAFSRTDNLRILHELPMEFMVTDVVAAELRIGESKGRPAVDLSVFSTVDVGSIDPALLDELDAGEASVIQAALAHQNAWVCIDEEPGRQAAQRLGLPVRGTLGLLLEAKQVGICDSIRPIIESMRGLGTWFSKGLIRDTLSRAGEANEA